MRFTTRKKEKENLSKRDSFRLNIPKKHSKKPKLRFFSSKKTSKPTHRLQRSNSLLGKLENYREQRAAKKSKQTEFQMSRHNDIAFTPYSHHTDDMKPLLGNDKTLNPPYRSPATNTHEDTTVMRPPPIIATQKSSQRAIKHYKRAAISMLFIAVLLMTVGAILFLTAISLPAFANLTALIATTEVAKQIYIGIGCALMPTGLSLTIFSGLCFHRLHKHTKDNKEIEQSFLDSYRRQAGLARQ